MRNRNLVGRQSSIASDVLPRKAKRKVVKKKTTKAPQKTSKKKSTKRVSKKSGVGSPRSKTNRGIFLGNGKWRDIVVNEGPIGITLVAIEVPLVKRTKKSKGKDQTKDDADTTTSAAAAEGEKVDAKASIPVVVVVGRVGSASQAEVHPFLLRTTVR